MGVIAKETYKRAYLNKQFRCIGKRRRGPEHILFLLVIFGLGLTKLRFLVF